MAVDFNTLNDLIQDVRSSREQVDRELSAALVALERLRTRQQELIVEEDAYVATLTRRFPDAQPNLDPVSAESFDLGFDTSAMVDWRAMPRTEAVERAIAQIIKTNQTRDLEPAASPAEIEGLPSWIRGEWTAGMRSVVRLRTLTEPTRLRAWDEPSGYLFQKKLLGRPWAQVYSGEA